MNPEDALALEPIVLTRAQQAFYLENGYLLLDSIVPLDWVERLREQTARVVDESRAVVKSDMKFDLEPGHTADNPRLRRLSSPTAHYPLYWEFASASLIADIAAVYKGRLIWGEDLMAFDI